MNHGELSREAANLRKAKDFEKALPLYEKLHEQYNDQLDEFELWGYAYCLQKLNHYQQALDISHEGLKQFPESGYLKNTYSWAIYYIHIQPEPVANREIFFKAAHAILHFSDPSNKYSPYNITVFSVIDLLGLNYELNVNQILEWINKLAPQSLGTDSFKFVDENGKTVVNASPLEKYYAILVKALHETGNFEACVTKANEALSAIEHFHNGNEIWIPRNKALALHALGQHQECVDILRSLLPLKPEWYIRMEIALAYEALKAWDKAFEFAIAAASQKSPDEMKLNLYMLLARLFRQRSQNREACLHVAWANQVRIKQGWPIDDDAVELIRQLDPDFIPPPATEIIRELKTIWAGSTPEVPRLKGKISAIFPNGKAGFIHAANGKDYYFSVRDFHGRKELLVKDGNVTFAVVAGFDRKKQKPSENAADIKIV